MPFQEPLFLFYVLPVFLVTFWSLGRHSRARRMVLIAEGLIFYAWAEPVFVVILLASMAADFGLSFGLDAGSQRSRKLFLSAGICQNLGILFVYKYLGFALATVQPLASALFGGDLPVLHFVLPIGVSFVVFEKISYLIDVYRGTTARAPSFTRYAVFVLFFPKLLAGPIVKYHEVEQQIAIQKLPTAAETIVGLTRFGVGAVKKVLIADPLATFADSIFALPAHELSFASAWLGVIAFTFQIFFDFSGYSDMAIGLGRVFGFNLRENFNKPYTARSLTDFWHRWHISLTTWVRDYLYIPLGGNQVSAFRTYVNLWICFLLSGLWHGASWNFILWGAYNGLVLSCERLFMGRWLGRLPRVVAVLWTGFIVMVGWVLFRATSLEQAAGFLTAMSRPVVSAAAAGVTFQVLFTLTVAALICLLSLLPQYDRMLAKVETNGLVRQFAAIAVVAVFVLVSARSETVGFRPFLYFRF